MKPEFVSPISNSIFIETSGESLTSTLLPQALSVRGWWKLFVPFAVPNGERAHVLVCRNDIEDCCYDPLNIPQDDFTAALNHTNTFSDTRGYVVPDTK